MPLGFCSLPWAVGRQLPQAPLPVHISGLQEHAVARHVGAAMHAAKSAAQRFYARWVMRAGCSGCQHAI